MSTYVLSLAEFAALCGVPESDLRRNIDAEDMIRLRGNRLGVKPVAVKRYLAARGVDYGFRVIAHSNLKGGVGKTTSAVSLATRAAQYGYRTCVLDLDSQGSASLAFGAVPADDEPIFMDIWQQSEAIVMAALRQLQDGLFVLPSALENALLDISLANPVHQKNAVRGVCAILQRNGFELVFIDCPPSLGAAVISAVCAADMVVIPVGFDAFSQKGLALTLSEIDAICETFGLPLPSRHILYTFFDRRVKQSSETWARLAEVHGERLIPVPIRTTTQFAKASNQQRTIFAAPGRSSAKQDYDRCLRYLLQIDVPCSE